MKTTTFFEVAALAGIAIALTGATARAQGLDDALPPRSSEAAALPAGVITATAEAAPATGTAPAASSTAPDVPPPVATESNWHIDTTFYLWFPGVHGNLNAFDYNVGFKGSASDLLSKLDFGLMGLTTLRYKRLVTTSDLFYVALSVNNTRVFELPDVPPLTSEVKERLVIFTEKVGYRIIDDPRIKIDGLTGFRFWHLGTTLTLTPSPFVSNPYTSRNWVDPLVGGRIQIPLSPKLVATIAGDVGGWGVGSQLDYQVVGALGYKISPKLMLEGAWRYLYLDYSSRSQFSSQIAMSGMVLGATYSLK